MIPPGRGAGEVKVPKLISPHELKALMEGDSPHAVVDVRLPVEFNAEQIFRTTNVPRGSLEFRIGFLVPVRSTPMVLVDGGGGRARLAAETLEREDYTGVFCLEGGLAAWKSASLPTISGTNVPSKEFGERVQHEQRVPEILADEMHTLIEGGGPVRIFDARTEKEFERFSIPGGQAIQRTDEAIAVRAGAVVTCCGANARATMVAYWLRRMGLKHVFFLKGGTGAWRTAGQPLVFSEAAAWGESPASDSEPIGLAGALEASRGLSTGEAAEFIGEGERTVLLDVDLSRSYIDGHLSGAKWISRDWLEDRIGDWAPDKGTPLLLTCEDGLRSAFAARTLLECGRREVFRLAGGKRAWREAGRPLDEGGEGIVGDPLDVALKSYDFEKEAMLRSMENYIEWEVNLGKKYEEERK